MIRRPTRDLRIDTAKPTLPQINFVHKDIDHPNRVALINPIFQAFRKQCALPAIRAFNEALHMNPRSRQESALRESHEAGRFHTVRVTLGRAATSPPMSGLSESGRS